MAKILCIDDEEFIRDDLCEFIETLGHEAIQAEDGLSGLKAIVKYEPDLILSDFTMPGMDGGELLTVLRHDHPECADIPFIFLSALADRHNILEGIKLGADDYLTKPIEFDMLENKIEASLRQVTRMKDKREKDFIKLFSALSGDAGEGKTVAVMETLAQVGAQVGAQAGGTSQGRAHERHMVYGTVFRFDRLEDEQSKLTSGVRADVLAMLAEKSLAFLKKTLPERVSVTPVPDGGILLCYMDGDKESVLKQTDIVIKKLESHLQIDQFLEFVRIVTIPSDLLRDLVKISGTPYETSATFEELSDPAVFLATIKQQIHQIYSDGSIAERLVSSIKDQHGRLSVLNLIREDDQVVPISFFDLDERSRIQISSCLALFNRQSRIKAKFEIDVMMLEFLYRDAKNYSGLKTVVVDVHHETISERQSLAAYRPHFQKFVDLLSVKMKVIVNVLDFPADRPNWYMEKLLAPFGDYASRRIVQVSPHHLDAFAVSDNTITAVVCSYKDMVDMRPAPATIIEAKKRLAKAGKLFILRSVPTQKDAKHFRKFGFNGCAISSLQPAT